MPPASCDLPDASCIQPHASCDQRDPWCVIHPAPCVQRHAELSLCLFKSRCLLAFVSQFALKITFLSPETTYPQTILMITGVCKERSVFIRPEMAASCQYAAMRYAGYSDGPESRLRMLITAEIRPQTERSHFLLCWQASIQNWKDMDCPRCLA